MAINFGSHVVATPAEKRLYQWMDNMNLTYRVRMTDQWESTINFEEGKPLDVFALPIIFQRKQSLIVPIKVKPQIVKTTCHVGYPF